MLEDRSSHTGDREMVDGLDALAEYVASASFDSLGAAAVDAVLEHTVDAFGCAFAAFDAAPCAAARRIAASGRGELGASVIGVPDRSTIEYATFANATMFRYLDLNDSYISATSGHPSDLIPAAFAAAEATRASGRDLLLGIHVGYEVFAALGRDVDIYTLGWDYSYFLGVAAAAAAAKVWALPHEQVAHALSMTLSSNLGLGVTRSGELSQWKGMASANAAMSGIFATRLAREGLTGPKLPFGGSAGLWHRATPPFEIGDVGVPRHGLSAVQRAHLKLFPLSQHSQAPVDAILRLRARGVSADDVEAIQVSCCETTVLALGGGRGDHDEKWNPTTRETADHSLPYAIAVALVDGRFDLESLTPARIRDPELRPVMDRITIVEDPALTATWLEDLAFDIEVTLRDGRREHIRAGREPGHSSNPLSRDRIAAKFVSNSRRILSPQDIEPLAGLLWQIPSLDDIDGLMTCLRDVTPCAN